MGRRLLNVNAGGKTPLVKGAQASGADVIKIYLELGLGDGQAYPVLDGERVRAIVEEAHVRGTLVRAHVSQLPFASVALDAGGDVIEHVPKPDLLEPLRESERSDNGAAGLIHKIVLPEYDTLLPRMAKQGTVMVPTLARGLGGWYESEEATPAQRVLADGELEIVRRFHGAGGAIALGTDYNSNTKELQADMFIREMQLLREADLSPMEVIQASTHNAAGVCGHGDELGALEPGKLADVIVVNGDPLKDIKTMSRVTLVVKDGEIAHVSR